MSRLSAIVALALGLFATPLATPAQPPGKVYRIGYLTGIRPENLPVFREELRTLGYTEGQNLIIEARYAEGRPDRLPALAAELARFGVDVILAVGNVATIAARHTAPTIPIVMAASYDPVGYGLVASLARPGGNITGLSWDVMTPEEATKRFELLKELAPKTSRIAVLVYPVEKEAMAGAERPAMEAAAASYRRTIEGAKRALGVQAQPLEVTTLAAVESAFAAMTKEQVNALIVLSSAFTETHRKRIVELAAQSRLPALYQNRGWVEVGGLMSYGVNFSDMFRRAAVYVDKILKGAKPADLPVEQPTKFELVINLKTAKALGLTIPPLLLARTDEVLQ